MIESANPLNNNDSEYNVEVGESQNYFKQSI